MKCFIIFKAPGAYQLQITWDGGNDWGGYAEIESDEEYEI